MKNYTIKRQCRASENYETMIIRNRETGDELAEYALMPGCEGADIAATRRAIDKHLAKPGATLSNYQW